MGNNALNSGHDDDPGQTLIQAPGSLTPLVWLTASPPTGAAGRSGGAMPGRSLVELQADYQQWLDGLPESLADTPMADALRAVCDLGLSGLEINPPRDFGGN